MLELNIREKNDLLKVVSYWGEEFKSIQVLPFY